MSGDSEDRTRLREAMRPGKAATKGSAAELAELALGVPPLHQVHLAEAGDENSQLQQSVQVERAQGVTTACDVEKKRSPVNVDL
jgi:hypothetical protein